MAQEHGKKSKTDKYLINESTQAELPGFATWKSYIEIYRYFLGSWSGVTGGFLDKDSVGQHFTRISVLAEHRETLQALQRERT